MPDEVAEPMSDERLEKIRVISFAARMDGEYWRDRRLPECADCMDALLAEVDRLRARVRELERSAPRRLTREELNADELECWMCIIGETTRSSLPKGSDLPMRQAIQEAFVSITGHKPVAIFSGWGYRWSEIEENIVREERLR